MNTFRCMMGAALLSIIPIDVGFSQETETNPLAEKVRKANDRFKDAAAAVSAGYLPMECASGQNGGAMGIHYVIPPI